MEMYFSDVFINVKFCVIGINKAYDLFFQNCYNFYPSCNQVRQSINTYLVSVYSGARHGDNVTVKKENMVCVPVELSFYTKYFLELRPSS